MNLTKHWLYACVFAVLQFVPSHIDVRMCTFSEKTEKGLITALAEVRRRSQESTNFTVNVSWLLYPVNIIKSSSFKHQYPDTEPLQILLIASYSIPICLNYYFI